MIRLSKSLTLHVLKVMKKKNPGIKIWSYFAIDWVRPVYAASTYLNAHADECLLKSTNGSLIKVMHYH